MEVWRVVQANLREAVDLWLSVEDESVKAGKNDRVFVLSV